MRRIWTSIAVLHLIAVLPLIAALPLSAQDSRPDASQKAPGDKADGRVGSTWVLALKGRGDRGKLQDAHQDVRGDSGRWSDEPQWQLAPAIGRKPENVSLDDWFDQLAEQKFEPTGDGDTWLLLRTPQLDDNDRVWLERIERSGNQFTIVVGEAKWQGKYFRNFTKYEVLGVKLGRLEPGEYEAKWITRPLTFRQFEGAGQPRDNWPKDERPAGKKPVELPLRLTVRAGSP